VLTTLYGAVSANVVVAPLLSRLQAIAVEQEVSMNLIKEWAVLISRGETRSVVDRLPATSLAVQTATGRLHQWEAVTLGAQH
jgi:flagellar motor component MotA